jgi:hypothetical protein
LPIRGTLHEIILEMLYARVFFAVVLAVLLIAWFRVHRTRRRLRAELRLQYDDMPDPVVRELRLLR